MLAVILDLALLALGTFLLVRGADWFMDGVSDLARTLGVSALLLGVVLAGLEPEEMITAAIASGRGAPRLAIGNVIGTNVTIVTLALGLSALLAPIALGRAVRRQALLATAISAVPIALLLLGPISRLAGALLLALFVAYTIVLFRTDRAALQRLEALEELEDDDDDDDDDEDDHEAGADGRPRLALMTLGGLAAMAVGGPLLVEGALRLTGSLGVGEGVVGATLVSLGTGGEMLALAVSAARKRRAEVLVGGIIGSFAYNLLVTLGLAAVVRPLPRDPQLLRVALPIMVGAHLALLALIWRGRIPRAVGGALVGLYVVYLVAVVLAR